MLSKGVAIVEFSIPHKDILDSVVGIVTCYWLDSQEFISRWGRGFMHPSKSALGPTQPPLRWVPGHLPRGKAGGINHPLPSSAKIKERVELYLNSPSGPSWPLIEWSLPLP